MKIVVIGGSGLIGSKTVAILRRGGHDVLQPRPILVSTRSLARALRRPWPARRW